LGFLVWKQNHLATLKRPFFQQRDLEKKSDVMCGMAGRKKKILFLQFIIRALFKVADFYCTIEQRDHKSLFRMDMCVFST
jgi:hypothetical protein